MNSYYRQMNWKPRKMNEFLETYNLPRLKNEKKGNLNKPITSIESETLKQNLQTKSQNQTASQGDITPNI